MTILMEPDCTALMEPDCTAGDPRPDLLDRYRHLRRISLELNNAAVKLASTPHLLQRARRLGLGDGRVLFDPNHTEWAVLMDLAIHTAAPGRTRAIDRLAKVAPPPPGSDEAAMLAAMRRTRFSVWETKQKHPVAGLIMFDLQRLAEIWLLDINLGKSVRPGSLMAGRVFDIEGFAMSCGAFVPLSDDDLEEAIVAVPGPIDMDPVLIAEHPRFAEEIYRAAIETGAVDYIRFRNVT